MIFGSKIIKVDILDEKDIPILSAEKNFVVPSNLSADEDSIVMIKGRNLPELDHNTIVSVVTTNKSGDRVKYMGAVSVSMDTQLNIKILVSNDNQVLQERRRFYKLKIEEEGRFLFFVRDEKTYRYDFPLPITIHDINVGGIFLAVEDEELMIGDMLCIEADLLEGYPLNAAVRVLRIQRDPEGKIAGYGCEFVGLTAAQQDYIGKFIHKVQSEQRQKQLAEEEKTIMRNF